MISGKYEQIISVVPFGERWELDLIVSDIPCYV